MSDRIRDKGRLEHILESIEYLFEFTQNITFSDFENDKMRKFAVVKNLEIIGEASYMISKQFKEEYPEIEWQVIVALCHVWYTVITKFMTKKHGTLFSQSLQTIF